MTYKSYFCNDTLQSYLCAFLATSEIQAKLISYGNIHRPIPLRTLCQILDKKGFQRMRNGNRRGYLVVELEATEINSRRIASTADLPF
ncbi:MAG: hypothetical protein ACI3ZD_16755 [Prevotella sp.]